MQTKIFKINHLILSLIGNPLALMSVGKYKISIRSVSLISWLIMDRLSTCPPAIIFRLISRSMEAGFSLGSSGMWNFLELEKDISLGIIRGFSRILDYRLMWRHKRWKEAMILCTGTDKMNFPPKIIEVPRDKSINLITRS